MRVTVDFDQEAGLQKFSGIVIDVLNSNLQAITTDPLAISILDAARCTPDDLVQGYSGGVLISATEGKTGFEIGLIFAMNDITMLADMMMMGDGEPRAELDNEMKDAVIEIANQFFGGLTVPVETQMGKKLQFRVDDAVKLQNTNSFQSDSYIATDMQGTLKGNPFQCRLYVDEGFSSVLDTKQEKMTVMPDFFGSAPESPRQSVSHNNPNMDMLMDIEIPVSVRMGSAQLFLKDILGLGPGNIVELDQNADESIELTVNDKIIARGEVVIVDGYFGFRIKEIISRAERIKKLKD